MDLQIQRTILANLNGVRYIGFPLYFDVYKSCTIISRFPIRWMICNYDVVITIHNYYVEWFVHDLWYVECFGLRWMIYTKLNNLYLQRWMCFDYVERFTLLLNDLYSSMKLPRNFLSHKNPHNEHCPIRNPSCEDSFNTNCFGTNKITDYL